MALPNKIQHQAITGASLPSTIDNDINAFKLAVLDIFGIPDNTNVSAAVMSVAATGLTAVVFRDAAGNPATAGHLQRNGVNLLFHDGTAARVLTNETNTATLTNKTIALGSNTVSGTTAQFNTALSDGDFATLAGAENLTNKTITAPVLSGTATGTYTLAGTPTITAPTFSGTAAGSLTNLALTTPTITTGTLAGTTTVSGGQLAFPATQSSSSDPNTLDDYEEGTWTPTVGGTTPTYTLQLGHYIKVGKMVTLWCTLIINAIGDGSTSRISGIPFAAMSVTNAWWSGTVSAFGAVAGGNIVFAGCQIVSAGTQIIVEVLSAAGTGTTERQFFGNSTTIRVSITYPAGV